MHLTQDEVRHVAELAKLLALDAPPRTTTTYDLRGTLDAAAGSYELESAIRTGVANRAEIRGLQTRVSAEAERVRVEGAGLKPEISLFGGYDFLSSQFEGPGDYTNGAVAGLTAEWRLFDFGATKARQEQARARRRQAELDVEDTRRQVELDVRKAWSRYQEARELIASQQKNIEAAEESVRQARVRVGAGTSTQLEVLDAQTALTQARTNDLQARADLKQAITDLRRAMGVLAPVEIASPVTGK